MKLLLFLLIWLGLFSMTGLAAALSYFNPA